MFSDIFKHNISHVGKQETREQRFLLSRLNPGFVVYLMRGRRDLAISYCSGFLSVVGSLYKYYDKYAVSNEMKGDLSGLVVPGVS